MSGLLQHIERWLSEHTRRFACLAPVTVPSAAATDDDVEWWSDLRYLQELADAILDEARLAPGAAGHFEAVLARGMVEFDTDIYLEPWPGEAVA